MDTQEDLEFMRELFSSVPEKNRSIYNIINFLRKNQDLLNKRCNKPKTGIDYSKILNKK